MNASLPGLPTAIALPTQPSAGGGNSELIQLDSDSTSGFTRLFAERYRALSADGETASEGTALFAALQNLPDGGKLLPLLQKTLDNAAAAGIDSDRLMQRLSAALDQLVDATDVPSAAPVPAAPPVPAAAQLALLLQPLVQQQPALKAVLPAEVAAALPRDSAPAAGEQAWRHLSLPTPPRPGEGAVDSSVATSTATTATTGRAPEQQLTFVPHQAGEASAPTADRTRVTALLDAMKRLSPEAPRAPASADVSQAGVAPSTTATAPGTALPAVSVNTPLGQADWDQALAERIQWLAGNKVQGAQVKLNPANLGPMEVRIHVHNDQATVQFTSGHAVVREALEGALPRLRDMFQASGVELVDVDVSGQSFAEQQQAMPDRSPRQRAATTLDEPLTADSGRQTLLSSFMASGRLDLFA